jgi:ATP-binding cassette subfamily B protein
VVLDRGAVAERGTHDQLIESGGIYASLWKVQTGDAVP